MFLSSLRSRPAAARRVRLSLESLDSRLLPDATPIEPPDAPAAADASNPKAPEIVEFGVAQVSTGWYIFSGRVRAAILGIGASALVAASALAASPAAADSLGSDTHALHGVV